MQQPTRTSPLPPQILQRDFPPPLVQLGAAVSRSLERLVLDNLPLETDDGCAQVGMLFSGLLRLRQLEVGMDLRGREDKPIPQLAELPPGLTRLRLRADFGEERDLICLAGLLRMAGRACPGLQVLELHLACDKALELKPAALGHMLGQLTGLTRLELLLKSVRITPQDMNAGAEAELELAEQLKPIMRHLGWLSIAYAT